MLLWTVFAVLTGIAVFAVLLPLSRRPAVAGQRGSDLAVYRDQLGEIDRDAERGLIAAGEAEAARLEVSRRLLDADAKARAEAAVTEVKRSRIQAAAVIGLVAVPLVTLGVYGRLGSPDLPDMPLDGRLQAPADKASIEELVVRVERHLEAMPEDGEGWDVIAPVYLRVGRNEDARKAFSNAIRLLGSTPAREGFLGEAIVAASGGVVTADARQAFQRALDLDPKLAKAHYYLGLAAEQDGDPAAAVKSWQAILAGTDAATPMGVFLQREIDRVSKATPGLAAPQAPGPTSDQVAAAQDMSQEDRNVMIRGMVERLAGRLATDGGSAEEWQRLIRAYAVLGDKGKATEALASARKALANDAAGLKGIEDMAKSLGLEG